VDGTSTPDEAGASADLRRYRHHIGAGSLAATYQPLVHQQVDRAADRVDPHLVGVGELLLGGQACVDRPPTFGDLLPKIGCRVIAFSGCC
jgi:hypothetical protein